MQLHGGASGVRARGPLPVSNLDGTRVASAVGGIWAVPSGVASWVGRAGGMRETVLYVRGPSCDGGG